MASNVHRHRNIVEDNPMNETVVALITKAEETIREQYPDEEGGA